ncbi:MAG: hypothetical protein ACHQD8_02700 [Chitinophagales bacterium]
MTKKILPLLLLVAIYFVALFSCKKSTNSNTDLTRNYFPLQFGKYVTYAVDSIYYIDTVARYEIKSQMKYAITDTVTIKKKLNYIMNVYTRPYDGADWQPNSVIIIQPTTTNLLYTQDGNQYVKLMFPITNGFSWPGNQYVEVGVPEKAYFKNWNYTYNNYRLPYFNGIVNFDNTVTVNEDDESSNYMYVDSQVTAYRTYAKEVYAYNIGMIYKEWTHWTHNVDTIHFRNVKNGYTVIMQAIEHN